MPEPVTLEQIRAELANQLAGNVEQVRAELAVQLSAQHENTVRLLVDHVSQETRLLAANMDELHKQQRADARDAETRLLRLIADHTHSLTRRVEAAETTALPAMQHVGALAARVLQLEARLGPPD